MKDFKKDFEKWFFDIEQHEYHVKLYSILNLENHNDLEMFYQLPFSMQWVFI